jgi:hypothetical protein
MTLAAAGAPSRPLSGNRSSLCSVLLWMASDTFRWLESGYRNPPAPNEESFTDMNIRHLRDFLDRRVKVIQFDKSMERVNGADWEMWIHNRSHGIGLRIQAKKADKGGRYLFDHEVRSQRAYQCDQLIQHAAAVQCVPVYLLYNHWSWSGGAQEEAADAGLLCGHLATDDSHHGCTLVSAHDVQAELYRRQQNQNIRHKRLLGNSLPWNRVLCDERLPRARRNGEEVLRDIFAAVQYLDGSGRAAVANVIPGERRAHATGWEPSSVRDATAQQNATDAGSIGGRSASSRWVTPSHIRWGEGAFAQIPYEDSSEAADAVLEDGLRVLPDHVQALLDAHEFEPPPPPVPTRCTLLYDVSDEGSDEPPADFFGCVRQQREPAP